MKPLMIIPIVIVTTLITTFLTQKNKPQDLNKKTTISLLSAGSCWADKTESPQISFLRKEKEFRYPASIILAVDQNAVLYAHADFKCNEPLEKSKNCNYIITHAISNYSGYFFHPNTVKVPCPEGISIKNIVSKASKREKEIFDFTNVGN